MNTELVCAYIFYLRRTYFFFCYIFVVFCHTFIRIYFEMLKFLETIASISFNLHHSEIKKLSISDFQPRHKEGYRVRFSPWPFCPHSSPISVLVIPKFTRSGVLVGRARTMGSSAARIQRPGHKRRRVAGRSAVESRRRN